MVPRAGGRWAGQSAGLLTPLAPSAGSFDSEGGSVISHRKGNVYSGVSGVHFDNYSLITRCSWARTARRHVAGASTRGQRSSSRSPAPCRRRNPEDVSYSSRCVLCHQVKWWRNCLFCGSCGPKVPKVCEQLAPTCGQPQLPQALFWTTRNPPVPHPSSPNQMRIVYIPGQFTRRRSAPRCFPINEPWPARRAPSVSTADSAAGCPAEVRGYRRVSSEPPPPGGRLRMPSRETGPSPEKEPSVIVAPVRVLRKLQHYGHQSWSLRRPPTVQITAFSHYIQLLRASRSDTVPGRMDSMDGFEWGNVCRVDMDTEHPGVA